MKTILLSVFTLGTLFAAPAMACEGGGNWCSKSNPAPQTGFQMDWNQGWTQGQQQNYRPYNGGSHCTGGVNSCYQMYN